MQWHENQCAGLCLHHHVQRRFGGITRAEYLPYDLPSVWLSRLPQGMVSAAKSTLPQVQKQKSGRADVLIDQTSQQGPPEGLVQQASCLPWGSTNTGTTVSWVMGWTSLFLKHCATPSATNLLDYSDGQQDCQGRWALEHSHLSITGTMGCFANMAETASSTSCHSQKPTGLSLNSDMGALGYHAL